MPLNKSCIGKEFAPLTTEVTVAPQVAARARRAVEAMIA